MKKRKGDAVYKYRSFKRKRISITTLERKSYFTHHKVDHVYHSLKNVVRSLEMTAVICPRYV